MGLDMYLSKNTYVKNWDHMKPEERHEVSVTRNGVATAIKPERISYITEEVCYWRKANAIHNWFVQNCQGGVDDCQPADVSREQLQELVDTITKILDTPEDERDAKANELLPPLAGFFFGSTDIDECYYEDLEFTKKELTKILAEPKEGYPDFIYQSSW